MRCAPSRSGVGVGSCLPRCLSGVLLLILPLPRIPIRIPIISRPAPPIDNFHVEQRWEVHVQLNCAQQARVWVEFFDRSSILSQSHKSKVYNSTITSMLQRWMACNAWVYSLCGNLQGPYVCTYASAEITCFCQCNVCSQCYVCSA